MRKSLLKYSDRSLIAAVDPRRPRLYLSLLFAMCGVGVSHATQERTIEVAQPILIEGGVCVSDVTYVTYSYPSWADVVDYTCKQNYLVADGHDKPVNLNAAHLAGIKAAVDTYHDQEQALYGDTVRVVIDLSAMDTTKLQIGGPDDLVRATLHCVLANAARSNQGWVRKKPDAIAARYLRVEIQGSGDFAELSDTYRFEDLIQYEQEKACYGDG